jgi:PAT family beta-lactamase induction signal transducer AmpG
LIVGAVLQGLAVASYAMLAYTGPDLRVFSAVQFADFLGIGFSGVALITYMSTLTSLGYTATQYALLSSLYSYAGKLTKGFSGVMVEWLAAGRTLLEGYALFFIGAGLLGIPALILCIVLARATSRRAVHPHVEPR